MVGGSRRHSVAAERGRDLRAAPLQRLRAACAPGWPRTVLVRRCAAAVLAAAAVVLMFRTDPDARSAPVLVAAHDLGAGAPVGAEDVRVVRRTAGAVPQAAFTDAAQVQGRTVAAPVRAGEALTDVRLLGAPLARAAAGVADARVVTVRLADPALAELVHAGDLVDIIAAPEDALPGDGNGDGDGARTGATLAVAAPVVLVPPAPTARSGAARGRVVLVALPAGKAARVAAVSMTRALTLTMH